MTEVNLPKSTVNILSATQTQSTAPVKVLFIGQKLAGGTASAGALIESIGNDGSEDTLFGQRSILASMIRQAKRYNKITRFDAIALDDNGSAVKATAVIALTGPATAAGTLLVSVGSRPQHQYTIAVANTDTATIIGDAIVAAITADADAPFTAVNVTGTVTITASNGGTLANSWSVEVTGTVTGVTYTVTGWTGGATDPTITTLLATIDGIRYNSIVWQHNLSLATVSAYLDARFNATNAVLDGRAFATKSDTLANIKAAANALNSKSLVLLSAKSVNATYYKGCSLFELPDVISAVSAAVDALRLTQDANITAYSIGSGGPADLVGGPHISAMPMFNTPLSTLPIIDAGRGFTATEVDELKAAGASVLGNNRTRTTILMGEIVTTYKTDAAGNPDTTFKYLEFVETESAIREIFFNNIKATFAQHRLTSGDVIPGHKIANASIINAEYLRLYGLMSGPGYVLTQAGQAAVKYFDDHLVTTIDLTNGRATTSMQVPIVTQYREAIVQMQIAFSTI